MKQPRQLKMLDFIDLFKIVFNYFYRITVAVMTSVILRPCCRVFMCPVIITTYITERTYSFTLEFLQGSPLLLLQMNGSGSEQSVWLNSGSWFDLPCSVLQPCSSICWCAATHTFKHTVACKKTRFSVCLSQRLHWWKIQTVQLLFADNALL